MKNCCEKHSNSECEKYITYIYGNASIYEYCCDKCSLLGKILCVLPKFRIKSKRKKGYCPAALIFQCHWTRRQIDEKERQVVKCCMCLRKKYEVTSLK